MKRDGFKFLINVIDAVMYILRLPSIRDLCHPLHQYVISPYLALSYNVHITHAKIQTHSKTNASSSCFAFYAIISLD